MHNHRLYGAVGAASILASVAGAVLPAGAAMANEGHIHKGPAVPLGQGTAQAWVSMDWNGEPAALGVSVSEAALRGIEALHHGAALTLPLPAEAAGTGFDHVLLNWNPHGHPPAHIWGSPHFDVHFYMISPAAREAISDKDPEFKTKARRNPEAHFVPVGYVLESEAIPAMGVHWADASTPEFHGKPFTHTLIYGAWDGQVTFIEPMIDKSVFDRRETVVADIRQPAAVAIPGRYPTQYRIDFDPAAAEHRVVLEGLLPRE
ncbi:MAG TPA: DUF5602 domain-containing protein [Azospirillum sp.]|nr:DUF5602 domain-containing protein [Azospirillum sp.]